ncbi:MAG: hypothetical protein JW820_17505, partial [Spirochaetales bacterium]|nr:hypothetical protein [Spirochaetales bacterium]
MRTETYQSMALRRFGEMVTVSQRDIWLESDQLERVETLVLMNGQRQELSAERGPEGLTVRQSEGGRSVERLLPATERLLGVYGAGLRVEEAVAAGAAGQAGSLRFQLFSPATGSVSQVEVTVLGPGELEDSRGKIHQGLLVEQ